MGLRLAETKQQQTINRAANDLTKGYVLEMHLIRDPLSGLLIESSADIRPSKFLNLAASPAMQQAI